jgi:predicted nucleotidyltransferase
MIDDQPDTRSRLLAEVRSFVRAAARVPGVRRIALLGSIVTARQDPKDVDLLVVISDSADLTPLATSARRLQGHAQTMNRGADVFLADERGIYLGRTCPWRECGPGIRASCDAVHCGRRRYLHDDLGTIQLGQEMIAAAPVDLWPQVQRRCRLPPDVESMLAELEDAA